MLNDFYSVGKHNLLIRKPKKLGTPHKFNQNKLGVFNHSVSKNLKILPLPSLKKNPNNNYTIPLNNSFDEKYFPPSTLNTTQYTFNHAQNMNKTLNITQFNERYNSKNHKKPKDLIRKNEDKFVTISKQGQRSYNQDRFFCHLDNNLSTSDMSFDIYGIFDGHGGHNCADFLQNNFLNLLMRSKHLTENPQQALKETFSKVQQQFVKLSQYRRPLDQSGSCAVLSLVYQHGIWVANLGDSRGLLLSAQKYLQLTHDHRPNNRYEKMRIIKNGGKIYRQPDLGVKNLRVFGSARILPGNLNVSRTFGDIKCKLKKYGGLPGTVIAEPQIQYFQKNNFQVLLLASDGLFEAYSNQKIHQQYQDYFQSVNPDLQTFINNLATNCQRISKDNITIILVSLQ